jgi:hypothetical protein
VSRRLVVTENITLDGVVENDGSWFDPTDDSVQERQLAEVTREHAAASDGFLVGRVTFEEMRRFWPRCVDDTTGVTSHLDQVEKYVGPGGRAEAVRLFRHRGPRPGLLDAKHALGHLTLAEARTFDGGVVLLRYTIGASFQISAMSRATPEAR